MKRAQVALAAVLVLTIPAAAQRPPTRPHSARDTDPWRVTNSRSEMTDQVSVTLELDALGSVPGPILDVRPVLVIRCHEERLDVFITTGAVLAHDDSYERAGYENMPDITLVRLRWGNDPPREEERWLRSTDYTAAFAPDPAAFLTQLLFVPNMRFEFRPFDAVPRVATFNARGLDRHLPAIDAACPRVRENPAVSDTDKGSGASLDSVFTESVVDEQPELVSAPQVSYPELLQQAGIQGRVIIQAIIDTSGRAEPPSVKVIETPNPGFSQPARDHVLGALFRPARVHGRAVRVLMRVPVEFKIHRP